MSSVVDLEPKKKKKLFSFIAGVRDELKKISWTSKKELISSVKIVLSSMLLFGISIYLVDLVIKGLLDGIKKVLMYII